MKDKPVRIIISKKKSGHGGGHHGGSWKIAYADFMTAMMALFLVMWLIAKSSPQELQGIAEYFRTPLILGQNGGKNISDSESPIPGGGDDVSKSLGEEQQSIINEQPIDPNVVERNQLIETARKIYEAFELDPRLQKLAANLIVELTEMGLRIQILATDDKPMFDVGSAVIHPNMQEILHALAPIINDLPNKMTLSGHTDERQYITGDRGYSNWELSADRANSSRRELIAAGLDSSKIIRIIGLADTVGLNNPNYSKDANRRISILILNKSAQKYIEDENTMTGIDFLKQATKSEK
ncbi:MULTISPECIES: flagellar motor protein MotB [unclassified Gilliamella]|uniref:flagellar motor protein MotB n=1 Tax=unclassified Gilliamella TaxID=2685620 RepID=UPI00226A6BA0|nr:MULTISPECIES: flagellar motor protein MotB [unclassified Gilliamella]MCX8597426.1 flagellar motor protein MotB [Gilliamella sp. B3493]MCX8599791.1 flagellar motor protein MotB [Gilliamella sp. B3486]MCX8661138.1 flagellar motor protein MotB [Gilliamella sp. B2772]MCX8690066.1 flagellar motor protein MotB [Gilliamella sp. B2973]MCX8705717.1 flagellar motor protein MotB [Gilliamella sp. B3127]